MIKNLFERSKKTDKFIGNWIKPKDNSLTAQVGRKKDTDFGIIVEDIKSKLEININDTVLDVCCGNGLITRKIANYSKEVYGLDFSEVLIRTAEDTNYHKNITYQLGDALNVDEIFNLNFFDKVYCYFSFQHIDYKDGERFIELMSRITKKNGLILIGDIPDKNKKWKYYNTTFRKFVFIIKSLQAIYSGRGQDSLGWWWDPSSIEAICRKLGLECNILNQINDLPHKHYRFDVLIRNR